MYGSAGNNSRSLDIVWPHFENVLPIPCYDRHHDRTSHQHISSWVIFKVFSVNKFPICQRLTRRWFERTYVLWIKKNYFQHCMVLLIWAHWNGLPLSISFTCLLLYGYNSSDWLLSGHYFLVMTGHYETFLGSFELGVKAMSAWAKTTKRWSKGGTTMFSITERKTSIQKHFSKSDEESHGARKRIWKITSGVLIAFFLRKALKRPYNK